MSSPGESPLKHAPLSQQAADLILRRIVEGDLAPGSELPPESVLAEELGVSRLTVREALKTLQSQGVVAVFHGRRGVVNPTQSWTALEPIIAETLHRLGNEQVSIQLLEMRRMIEVGSASLAAARRSEEHVRELHVQVGVMQAAHDGGDVESFVRADIAFHNVIFDATGNEFVRLVFEPLATVLLERRQETSAVAQVQVNAIACHRAIIEAIDAGDVEAARVAMIEHMDQTQRDLRELLGSK